MSIRENTMSMNMNEKLTGVTRTIKAKVRADDSCPKDESVSVFLDIDYSDCSVEDVLSFASADRRIAWANGSGGRKAIGKLKEGQHIVVKASSPGAKPPQTVEEFVLEQATAQGITVEQYLNNLKLKLASK